MNLGMTSIDRHLMCRADGRDAVRQTDIVQEHPIRERILAGQKRRPPGRAHGNVGYCRFKDHTVPGHSIHIRRVDLFVASKPGGLGAVLIAEDENDIGLLHQTISIESLGLKGGRSALGTIYRNIRTVDPVGPFG